MAIDLVLKQIHDINSMWKDISKDASIQRHGQRDKDLDLDLDRDWDGDGDYDGDWDRDYDGDWDRDKEVDGDNSNDGDDSNDRDGQLHYIRVTNWMHHINTLKQIETEKNE